MKLIKKLTVLTTFNTSRAAICLASFLDGATADRMIELNVHSIVKRGA